MPDPDSSVFFPMKLSLVFRFDIFEKLKGRLSENFKNSLFFFCLSNIVYMYLYAHTCVWIYIYIVSFHKFKAKYYYLHQNRKGYTFCICKIYFPGLLPWILERLNPMIIFINTNWKYFKIWLSFPFGVAFLCLFI